MASEGDHMTVVRDAVGDQLSFLGFEVELIKYCQGIIVLVSRDVGFGDFLFAVRRFECDKVIGTVEFSAICSQSNVGPIEAIPLELDVFLEMGLAVKVCDHGRITDDAVHLLADFISISVVSKSFVAEALVEIPFEGYECLVQVLEISIHACQRIGRQSSIGKNHDWSAGSVHRMGLILFPISIVEAIAGQVELARAETKGWFFCRAAIREKEEHQDRKR